MLRLPKFGSCPGKHIKLHKLVLVDCKLKLHEIAEELKISEGSVFTILHEYLTVRRVDSSRWKPSKGTTDTNISRQGFGLHILGCTRYFLYRLPWERKNHQYRTLYSTIGAFEGRNRQKTATDEEEESALSSRQCTMSQVDCIDGKTTWIAIWIASAPIPFSRSGSQQLLAVCRPQKNAPEKEI